MNRNWFEVSSGAIRWLGAYRGRGMYSLHDSLHWELEENNREVAAEWWDWKSCQAISRCVPARLGLLVKKGGIIKRYFGDCYSEYRENNRLVATRRGNDHESHTECFVRPRYTAIVSLVYPERMRKSTLNVVREAQEQYGLPFYTVSPRWDSENRCWRMWFCKV